MVLSLLITGVGQIYLGKVARGLGWLFGALGFGFVVAAAAPGLVPILYLTPVAAAIDAYVQAGEVDRGR